MPRPLQFDRWLIAAVLALVVFGTLMVYSASAVMASELYGRSYYFLLRQAAWAVGGLAVMAGVMNIDYRRLRRPTVVFSALGLGILLLVVVLLGGASHHAHRWLHVGRVGFQPSEFAKVALVVFLAYFLDLRKNAIDDWRHTLAPVALVAAVIVFLVVKEPDLGTALTIGFVVAAMLFAAGLHWGYFAAGFATVAPVIAGLIYFVPYRWKRILAFLNPEADPLGKGFQIIQAKLAVGTGGIDGVGYMAGKQKLFYLPEPHSDFIFGVMGEELGFLGCIAVLAVFLLVLQRGLRAAAHAPDAFGRLLAMGLTVFLVGQALINISVVVGLLPPKGIPLPFVSYGGSSLLMNLVAAGILLNISQHAG